MENYFDLLKLRSDVKDAAITEAIDNYEKLVKGKQGHGDLTPDQLKEETQRIAAMRSWASNKDAVKQHRESFISAQSEVLRKYFKSLETPYECYRREMESWINSYRLAEKIVEGLMKECNIKQIKGATLPPDFIFTNYKNDLATLKELRENARICSTYPWAKTVDNFYAFLAGAEGTSVIEIRKKDTAYLASLIAKYKEPMIASMGVNGADALPVKKVFASLPLIFDPKKPEARTKYDNTLQYITLVPLFEVLKSQPNEVKKEDKFVEHYLSKIKAVFDSDELAIAIYNKEAGLLSDPYEPAKVTISIRCSNCGTMNSFPSHEHAKKGKCQICGLPFYVPCPNCGQLIPASSNVCASCNFNVGEFHKTRQYFTNAKNALLKGDMNEAHLYLEQAMTADPKRAELGKIPDFNDVSRKIQTGYEQYSKYFTGITNLIASKSFVKAKAECENVKRNYPSLDISSHMKKINEALDKAKAMMPSPTDYTEGAALKCFEILEMVVDYLPAKEHLRKVNLTPPTDFRVVALQGAAFGVSISYSPSKHSRVAYYLTRNDKHVPATYTDGVILLKESTQTRYEDSKIEPGKAYYYAVFVTREGVVSPGASARFAYYADVEKLEAMPVGAIASISFQLPTNAMGVRIFRKENGIPSSANDPQAQLVCPNSRTAFEDKSVQLDHQYGYLVQAIYSENNQPVYSSGKGALVRIERDPTDLQDVVIEKINGAIRIKYRAVDATSPNPVRLYTIKSSLVAQRLHNLMTANDLQAYIGSEKLLGSGRARDGGFSFTIAGDYSYSVAVISMTDSKARICGLGNISSIPTLEVDKKKSQIKDAGKAYIRLKEVPANCFGIHYMVLDAGHKKNEITREDIVGHQTSFVSGENYRLEGLLDVRGRAISSGAFRLLVCGEFVLNGQHVYGQTSVAMITNAGPRTIGYLLKWEKKGLFKKTYSAVLNITCKGDLPEVALMARNGGTPVSASDANAYEVLKISADSPDLKKVMDTYSIDVPADYCQPGMNFRLFLTSPDDECKITASDYASLTCPK